MRRRGLWEEKEHAETASADRKAEKEGVCAESVDRREEMEHTEAERAEERGHMKEGFAKEEERPNAECFAGTQRKKQAEAEYGEAGRPSGKHRFRLTGSIVAKVTAVLLMLISAATCVLGGLASYVAAEGNMYVSSYNTVLKDGLQGEAQTVAYQMYNYFNNDFSVSNPGRRYLDGINAEVAVLERDDILALDSCEFIWQSYQPTEAMEDNGFYSWLYADVFLQLPAFDQQEGSEKTSYIVRVFFDPAFEKQDDIRMVAGLIKMLYQARYWAIAACVGSALLMVICIIFLLCAAGHRNGREGIVPGVLTGIPFDILTLGFAFLLTLILNLMAEYLYGLGTLILSIIFCMVALILGIIFLWDFAIRLKMGKLWRYTVIYKSFRLFWQMLRGLWRLIQKIPLVWTTITAYLVLCILELLGLARFARVYSGGQVLWLLEKLAVFVVVLYTALVCKKLLKASRELAEGHADYRVDTKYMFGDFKEHGENLNSLGLGVSKAVAEKMKSERLKTELITNVSHDIKTPLTSIINYAELIGREAENSEENQKLQEYSEVLLRQSGRLRRLLENLVEASKAVTGSLEVHLEPCEAGVLLSQAVGEYQQRMEEKNLELRVSQPEESVKILADGRHLWRVFDNLLSNICKYSQEGSRVYLTLEQKEGRVFIIFRNMSKYALDISADELEERFVRGDKSRHMEGNGLGLSIARSLVELQNGLMNIVVDGDLFKVTLVFELMRSE